MKQLPKAGQGMSRWEGILYMIIKHTAFLPYETKGIKVTKPIKALPPVRH